MQVLHHSNKNNKIYTFAGTDAENQNLIETHRTLGHLSFKRMRDLRLQGTDIVTRNSKRRHKAPTCPVCVVGKMKRAPSTTSSTTTKSIKPWQKVYIDLNGKMRIRSYNNTTM